MRKLAHHVYVSADLAYGWSLIVTGAALIGVGWLPIWNA